MKELLGIIAGEVVDEAFEAAQLVGSIGQPTRSDKGSIYYPKSSHRVYFKLIGVADVERISAMVKSLRLHVKCFMGPDIHLDEKERK